MNANELVKAVKLVTKEKNISEEPKEEYNPYLIPSALFLLP